MNELLSVVDKNDNIIKSAPRSEVHKSRMWHRGVHIFLYDGKGRMLVQLRSKEKDKHPNTLDCISEHSVFGESYEDAAKRGLNEELGISPQLKPLVHFRMIYGSEDYMICKLFECKHIGKLKPNSEMTHIYFLSENELLKTVKERPSRVTPWFREMLKWKFGMPTGLEPISKL